MNSLAYYITAHGYGHGARSCDILCALMDRIPAETISVVTDLPESFILNRLPAPPKTLRARSFDVGMVQLDSIRVDLKATEIKIGEALNTWPDKLAEEVKWLEENEIQGIICDIPGIPLEAADQLGIPGLAVGNFSWDWIYQPFQDRSSIWQEACQAFAHSYNTCDLLLRLPFADEMSAFPIKTDIPIVATPGQSRRAELNSLTGCDSNKPTALLSFTTLDLSPDALNRVFAINDWQFITVEPLSWEGPNVFSINREDLPFKDILASCDLVVTKPGFGILSECAVNHKPMVYADRSDFAEYPILEAAIKKHFQHAHIPSTDLYAGLLQPYLDQGMNCPAPTSPLPAGGDRIAADHILSHCTGVQHVAYSE